LADTGAREQLLASVQVPAESVLNTGLLSRGIDNYHVDVRLSDAFVLHARELISKVVKRISSGNRPFPNSEDLDDFREAYKDMMTTSLHRTRMDLVPEELQVLQFGIIKFLLKDIRAQLQGVLETIEEQVGQQQYAGSRSLLATQEKLAWFRRHQDVYLYRANRAIMQQVQRQENALRDLRKQITPSDNGELLNVLFNPMLCAESPTDTCLLAESYALWPNGGKDFPTINLRLEDTLAEAFPELEMVPLKNTTRIEETEVYDTLHGLFNAQDILGASEDQSTELHETYSWLEHPGNIRLLFDSVVQERELKDLKDNLGMKGQWDLKSDLKKLHKISADLKAKMFDDMAFREAIACYQLRGDWSLKDQQIMDVRLACAYVAGNDTKKILAKLDATQEGTATLLKRLDAVAEALPRLIKDEGEEYFLRILSDLCRYRLHLKYFRFAHRALNRIQVITEPEAIQLAKAGGKLYELLRRSELKDQEDNEPQIVRHVILKADVRGSTTVTRELLKKELNPASYFSLRFFEPITERLAVYGAVKVFIEGDAVILGIYEHDNEPNHWYAVARACGMAKEILDIVSSKNAHSAKTGLPGLEVGIGICFEDDKPLFLFDGDRPIMISSAIGTADRLSSCSWQLRQSHEGAFNVDVLALANQSESDKGQKNLHYNLNGVLLDTPAFKKLLSEIPMKKLKLKVSGAAETMYVGKFPDVQGKERELVVREGVTGQFAGGKVSGRDGAPFYEVLPNSKLARQVLEHSRKA
jgi:hypothetical protein